MNVIGTFWRAMMRELIHILFTDSNNYNNKSRNEAIWLLEEKNGLGLLLEACVITFLHLKSI